MIRTILTTGSLFAAGTIFTAGFFFHIFLLCAFFGLDLDFVMCLMSENVTNGVTTTVGLGDINETREGVINVTRTLEQHFTTKNNR
jgi:hypothetical protein